MSESEMEQTPHILLVDDEPRALELLARTLRGVGKIDRASTGDEASAMLDDARYDLVISDQRMPGRSGVDLLSEVAERDETCGRILLTGYADLEATVEAINRGRVHAYVHKPCPPDDLLMVVDNVLQRARLARENDRLVSVLEEKNAELTAALGSLRDAQTRAVDSERLAAIGKMIAMLIHDLRGPLAVIRSAGAELVRAADEQQLAEISELGSEVVRETERTNRLCQDLLETTRPTRDAVRLAPADFDESVASALAPLFQTLALEGVTLEDQLASSAQVQLDTEHWRRVVENLVRNAAEAMPDGGHLRVETRRDGERAIMTVLDDGPGLAPEIEGELFEPFVTSGKKNGTGLGLAIVKRIVEDHAGGIEVSKAAGGGTCFELWLPVAEAS